ncbi:MULTISPECIES: hypothetical protein [Hyphomicrobiales]|jgi:hypothetical protein|uniref:Uncharacterized protein n=2 Tax=Bosea TaxID=85413 RepID=A0A0N1F060_9HYPH|nr:MULTISPECIES: hypothetical protein [Hyphomicrobiales]KPH76148.1 hypothetical protein AE618_23585 [Bosea vaviloviae]
MGLQGVLFAAAGLLPFLVASTEIAQAHPSGLRLGAQEITQAVHGKLCTTPGGARFAFGADGHFAYDGLWQTTGSYVVADNSIVVTFDSGLRRAFAMSVRDGVLYMEQTRVSCANGG